MLGCWIIPGLSWASTVASASLAVRAKGGRREDRGRKGIFFQTLYEVASGPPLPLSLSLPSAAAPLLPSRQETDSETRPSAPTGESNFFRSGQLPVEVVGREGGTEAARGGVGLATPPPPPPGEGRSSWYEPTILPSFLSLSAKSHINFFRRGEREGGRVG